MDMAYTTDLQGSEDKKAVPRRFSFWRLALLIPEVMSAAVLAGVILFLVISVFSRYAMDLGLPWSDELARLLFAWIVLVGFAIAVRHRANVGVDWLVMKLSTPKRRAVTILQDVVVLGFSLVFTWQAWVTVGFSLMQRLPALDITIAWLYGSALVAGVLMTLYSIANLRETLQGRLPPAHFEISSETARAE